MQVSHPLHIPEEMISHSGSGWPEVPQVPVVGLWGCSWQWCVVGCASWLLSTVLVVSLGWPRPGSGCGPGLSDVITSLLGGCYNRLWAPPRISHTLTVPPSPTYPPTLPSLLLSIGYFTAQVLNTHKDHPHMDIHTRRQASVVCFVSLTAGAQSL